MEIIFYDKKTDDCLKVEILQSVVVNFAPFQLEDERLGSVVKWIKAHNLTIVKMESINRHGIVKMDPVKKVIFVEH